MDKFESIDAWKNQEVAQLEKVERSLHIIRSKIIYGTHPVAAFVLGGNRVFNDSVDSDYAHHLGRIAFNTGVLDGFRDQAYSQDEVISIVPGLQYLGHINQDPNNPTKYFYPTFTPTFAR